MRITPKPANLDREIQINIGDRLRAIHDDIVKQGIPDRFADLLSQLDKGAQRKTIA